MRLPLKGLIISLLLGLNKSDQKDVENSIESTSIIPKEWQHAINPNNPGQKHHSVITSDKNNSDYKTEDYIKSISLGIAGAVTLLGAISFKEYLSHKSLLNVEEEWSKKIEENKKKPTKNQNH